MTSAEFTEWQGYYDLEPFGELVADQRHGVATSLLANLNRDSKVRPKPYTADDFIHWRETKPAEDPEPEFIDDVVAQSNLIRAKMFGLQPK